MHRLLPGLKESSGPSPEAGRVPRMGVSQEVDREGYGCQVAKAGELRGRYL
jgi:hypothetical protein